MLNNMLISVVVSVYKSEEYLQGFFENLLLQTYKNFEVVLVLNDPSEKELSILESYQSLLNIVYIKVPLELTSTSVNRCLKIAKGDIIVATGTDDLFVETAFEKFIQTFLDNPDIDIVYCDFIAFKSNGKIYWIGKSRDYTFESLKNGNYISPCQIFKKSVFDKEGGYKEEYNYASDYEFMLRLGSKGYNFMHIPEVLFKFIRYSNSYTIKNKSLHEKTVIRIKDVYKDIVKM